MRSTAPMNSATINDTTITITVEPTISSLVGQVIFFNSPNVSLRYCFTLSTILRAEKLGRPGGIRTPNFRFWRPALYQFELLA